MSLVGNRVRQVFSSSSPIDISPRFRGRGTSDLKQHQSEITKSAPAAYSASPTPESLAQDEELPIYTLAEVSYHDTPDDCWTVIYDRVYDVTNFLLEVLIHL
jgi:cytochrome b involved in lipid metabolism